MKTPEAFVNELDAEIAATLARLGEAAGGAGAEQAASVADLLQLALKKELEASEEAALWLVSEADVEVKLALARQCGDEAKHYRLIEDRLRALGVDPSTIAPQQGGRTPMFEFLASLETTVERVAAGPFAREALAQAHNAAFIEYCQARGDAETARLYRDTIQPDEAHHHGLGRRLLVRLARTEAEQDLARRAAARTLAIAGELAELARLKKGIRCAPGC
jgi:bacterioferritin (cytochrome b1)